MKQHSIPMNLLAIDDDVDNRSQIERIGYALGYNVSTANDVKTLNTQLDIHCPDVVALNLTMREANSYNLIEILAEECPDTHLLIMSAGDPVHLETCEILARHWGMKSVIAVRKPLDAARISSVLAAIDPPDPSIAVA